MTMFVIIYLAIGWGIMFGVCKEFQKDDHVPQRLAMPVAGLLLATIVVWPLPLAYYLYERYFFLTR